MLEVPRIEVLIEWGRRNLGLSILPFGITLVLYLYSLRVLQRRLDDNSPLEEVSQLEHLVDVWTSLFFGIGVIWTAIGMRSALLYALGDPAVAAESGAFTILRRLVDGGILTALTTTIVGGIGGYMMRVIKSSYLGTKLSRYYEEQEQHHAQLGQLTDFVRVVDQPQARRTNQDAGDEKAGHNAEAESAEHRDGDHRRREQEDDIEQECRDHVSG